LAAANPRLDAKNPKGLSGQPAAKAEAGLRLTGQRGKGVKAENFFLLFFSSNGILKAARKPVLTLTLLTRGKRLRGQMLPRPF
jgi:hypothetical protein